MGGSWVVSGSGTGAGAGAGRALCWWCGGAARCPSTSAPSPLPLTPAACLPRPLQNGETAPDPLPEEKDNINGMQLLSMESTSVNQAFRQQVLPAGGGERHALAEPCPADLAQEGCGYK